MKNFNFFSNKHFRFMAVLCLLLVLATGEMWGDPLKLSDLVFSTESSKRIVNEDFSGCSTRDNYATKSANSDLSNYGVFNKIYNNSTNNHYKIESTTFSSNALELAMGSSSPCGVAISGKTFGTAGAWRLKTTKTAKMQVGIYAEGATGTLYAKANASVWVQVNAGDISISQNTKSGNWQSVGSYTSNTYIDICVIYNQSGSATTYGNSISIANNTAHVYVDGNCVMNAAGTAPKDFIIPGATLSTFRVYGIASSGNKASVDDLQIWNELPTAAASSTYTVNLANSGSTTGGLFDAEVEGGKELNEAEEGDEITLSYLEDTGYEFTNWTVYKTGDQTTTVTVTNDVFDMPAYNVTVDATFTPITRTISYSGDTHISSYTTKPTSATIEDDYITVEYTVDAGFTITGISATMGGSAIDAGDMDWDQTELQIMPTGGITGNIAITFTLVGGYCISAFNSSNNGITSGFSNGGSGNEYTLSYTIPGKDGSSNWPKYWIGENEAFQSFSADALFADLQFTSSNATIGLAQGATGTLHIWDDNKADGSNLHIKFEPSGYGFRWGGADWSQAANTKAFTVDAGNSNVYWTDIVSLDGTNNTSWNYYVGLQTASGYVYSGVDNEGSDSRGISRTRSVTAMKVSNGTSGSFKATYLDSEPTGSKGKFRIWNNNITDYNFVCHWVPFYQLSYNPASNSGTGTGSICPSSLVCCEESASNRTVDVATCTFTAPSGKRFSHWNTKADNSGTTVSTSTLELTSNVTLYAIWENIPTVTLHTPGGTSTINADETLDDADVPTACGDCWEFAGWTTSSSHSSSSAPATLIASGTTIPHDPAYTDLYAVYKKEVFARIKKMEYIAAGTNYLFTFTPSSSGSEYALSSNADGDNAQGVDVTSLVHHSDSIINPDPAVIWRLSGSTDNWNLYNAKNASYLNLSDEDSPILDDDAANLSISQSDTYWKSSFIINDPTTTANCLTLLSGDHDWAIGEKEDVGGAGYIDVYRQSAAKYMTTPDNLTHTVTWDINNGASKSTTTVTVCASELSTLPSAPADNTLSCSDAFVGWSATDVGSYDGNGAPSILFDDAYHSPYIKSSRTFYAVFATKGTATGGDISSSSNLSGHSWTTSNIGSYYSGNGPTFDAVNDYVQSADISSQNMKDVIVKLKAGSNGAAGSVLTISTIDADGNTIATKTCKPTESYTSQTRIYTCVLTGNKVIKYVRVTMTTKKNNVGMKYCLVTPYKDFRTYCCTQYGITLTSSGSVTGGSFEADKSTACEGETVTLTATPSAGYEFTSWTAYETETPATTVTVTSDQITMPAYGVTVNATFTPLTYTVTLKPNGGSGSDQTVTATYAADMPLVTSSDDDIVIPTRTGYTFAGWYDTDASSGGTQYYSYTSSTLASARTWNKTAATNLYARWTPIKYTMAVASLADVTIEATDPVVAEGSSASVDCGSTVTLSYSDLLNGKEWSGWKVYQTGDESTTVDVDENNQFTMPPYGVTVSANLYADFVFNCAELELTGPTGNLVFITSSASQTVRSQEAFHVVGTALSPSQNLTFTISPSTASSKFAFKKADGTAVATDANGKIDTDFYIFYTPAAEDDEDGLDEFTSLTVSMTNGTKHKSATLDTKTVMGRHLPTDFVIAAKYNGKWYALPDTMTVLGTPKPIEIAVDDNDNPSIAYTASTTLYGLAGPTSTNISGGNGQYIRFTMTSLDADSDPEHGHAPLFGSTTGTAKIGKSGTAQAASNLSAGWWWKLIQKNTSITNPQDATYQIFCANNDTTLSLKENAGNPKWGLYKNGYEELRLIPASAVEYTTSEVVAWGQKKLILEVAKPDLATQARAKIGDGSWSAYKSLATTTGTSKGTATKYNYTLDFTSDDFDFAAHEGEMLIVELHNAEGSALKATSVIIPRIVATNTTINKSNYTLKTPWNTEVHVLPGVTLTLDASAYDPQDMTFKELNIYPGATVVAEKGTLKATTLILRNGWDRLSATKTYDVARLYITPTNGSLNATTAYADWYIDFDQYYPIAVPWEVDLGENNGSTICYKNTKTKAIIGLLTTVRLRYYDGASRAKGLGDASKGENWKHYGESGCEGIPEKLEPSKAYAMTAKRPTGKAFSIIRMPLTIPSTTWTSAGEKGSVDATHKDQVTVTAYNNDAGDAAEWARGWNFIANPYMSLYQGPITHSETDEDNDYDIAYVNIPDINFNEYEQLPAATTKLKPASGFLIQTEADGTLTFGTTHRKASAPSFRTEEAPQESKQKAYILLSDQEANDMMGLIISDQYTAEYEMNADLEKLLGDGTSLKTYMRYNEMNMAYVAINETLAKEWIPVTVRIPENGEYTFSIHEASIADELEGVYLIDYQNGDQVTNLLVDGYTFNTTAGTISNRFAINAMVGERETPTAIDVVGMDKDSKEPIKFLWHDKVFIWFNGVIYDATGKKVR